MSKNTKNQDEGLSQSQLVLQRNVSAIDRAITRLMRTNYLIAATLPLIALSSDWRAAIPAVGAAAASHLINRDMETLGMAATIVEDDLEAMTKQLDMHEISRDLINDTMNKVSKFLRAYSGTSLREISFRTFVITGSIATANEMIEPVAKFFTDNAVLSSVSLEQAISGTFGTLVANENRSRLKNARNHVRTAVGLPVHVAPKAP